MKITLSNNIDNIGCAIEANQDEIGGVAKLKELADKFQSQMTRAYEAAEKVWKEYPEFRQVTFDTMTNEERDMIDKLKNNPKNFYKWRNCFLDVYFKKILSEDFSDDELVALYNIVNAWISEEIESSVRYGGNQLEHLYHYNYRIIEKIKNEELRKTLISRGKSSPKATTNIDDYVVKPKDNNKHLIDEICKNGPAENTIKSQGIFVSFQFKTPIYGK